MIKIVTDTLTPKLKRVRKQLPESVARELKKLMKFGKSRARGYVRSNPDMVKGIGYKVDKKRGKAEVFSVAEGKTTGFPYNRWVNRDVSIKGKFPYFDSRYTRVVYGKKGHKSPSGNPIIWRMTPAFMDRTYEDMKKRYPKTAARIRKILK